MIIAIKIEVSPSLHRPGIAIAQTLREIIPMIETMVPLKSSSYLDRFSSEVRAEWTCGDEPLPVRG